MNRPASLHLREKLPRQSNGRSFYSGTIAEFLTSDSASIIGQLACRHVAFHAAVEADQLRAWDREIAVLKPALSELGEPSWWVMLEVPLLRLGKRLDTVVLGPGLVIVIEFKIGAAAVNGPDLLQTERYSQCLRDFHEASQSRTIIPVLCAEKSPARRQAIKIFDGVAELIFANSETLAPALKLAAQQADSAAPPLDALAFFLAPSRPTPTIVEAAQFLYAGHEIDEIGRGDAADNELQAAAERLQEVAAEAEASNSRVICFVTGAPGAGKTLLGLDLALKSRSGTRPAALLSGNRPLVHVLTEALAADSVRRVGGSLGRARYEAGAAIQNLLGYLKEHTDGAPPPEHVIVFDEAQRAWNEDVGQELMGRPRSEPELFLNILDFLDWSCLVCLVGPGQEINRGEVGLPLWGEALEQVAARGRPWQVVAAPQALDGGTDIAGFGLLSRSRLDPAFVRREPRLHLANGIRAYRNPLHGRWVAALLASDLTQARSIAEQMSEPPAFLTRELSQAKSWLRVRRRGGRSVGLLTSSGAVRLVGEGVPPAPRSNELGPIGHWFLKPYTDFRSAGALETPMSEFGCQGLELDYTGLCWGGDLIWSDSGWITRMMRAPRWQIIHEPEKQRFRLNRYRVLLTRPCVASVIFVPRGAPDDATRSPREADRIASALLAGRLPTD